MFNFYALEQQAKNRHKRTSSQRTYMKKERFATQDKTKKCSFCKNAAVRTIPAGKSIRRLCGRHLEIYNNRNEEIEVTFKKASEI